MVTTHTAPDQRGTPIIIHPDRPAGPTPAAAEADAPPRPQFYPAYSYTAATFADLFNTYLMTWVEVIVKAEAGPSPSSRSYGEHLFRVAERVAAQFPRVELWDHLDRALRHAMRWYDPRRGPFDKLFEKTLRERLHKTAARGSVSDGRRRRAEQGYAASRFARSDADESAAAYYRWAAVLLDRACEHLDPQTRTLVEMRRDGERVAAVAGHLGVSEQALNNRYGGEKLARKVRGAVRRIVLDLPEEHRRLLVRHLLEEAGLRHPQVEALLRVRVGVDETVPVLEEGELLRVLGWWAGEKCSECSATGEWDREYVF